MLFNTAAFFACFLAFFAVYHLVPLGRTARTWLLFAASVLFYATFSPRFLPWLLGTGLVDYAIAGAIARAEGPRRKRLLVLSIVMNLSVLAWFKYVDFFLSSAGQAAGLIGIAWQPRLLRVVLPVGISFYTFQSMSYIIDVYRGTFVPQKRVHEFLASLTFFPHLVAGPIVRSAQFLPQLRRAPGLTRARVIGAALLVAGGLVKKTVADLCAPMVERIFDTAGTPSALDAWTGAIGFAAQVYGDFSGYTDIAIGIALLLHFDLPTNFDLPYLATSPIDFWRRWHISLSSWLHDYLYMPLAMRFRRSPVTPLVLTWLLAGLWHGASWTFVAWGAYHGVVLSVTHTLKRRYRRLADAEGPAVRVLQTALTMYLVLVGYVLFRATTLARAGALLIGMHAPRASSTASYGACLDLALACAALVGCHALDLALRRLRASAVGAAFVALLALTFAIVLGRSDQGFLYFAF